MKSFLSGGMVGILKMLYVGLLIMKFDYLGNCGDGGMGEWNGDPIKFSTSLRIYYTGCL